MDTLNNIAYNIAEAADKAEDFSVVERIKKLIIYYRALFIRRSVEKNNFLSSHFKQSITTKTTKVKDYNHGGTSIRTLIEIPKTIRLKHNESFTYVGGIDGITPFNEITQRQSGLLKYDKFAGHLPRYYIKENYVYIVNTNPEYVLVEGIFEDPTAVSGFTDDSEFPMSSDMTSLVITTILTTEFKIDQSKTDEL